MSLIVKRTNKNLLLLIPKTMNKNKRVNMMNGVLRTGVCLFMLSGSCVLSAQAQSEDTGSEAPAAVAPARPASQPEASKYKMRDVSGYVYDAATKEPLAGVRVQALNNIRYVAMTDENGAYTIRVPEFVTTLFISTSDYNSVQIGIKSDTEQNAYLYTTHFKDLYTDGTKLLSTESFTLKDPSALTVENEIENKLNSSVRTINRGGLPAQGAVMFMNGLNSLNANAQPLIVIDGVVCDMQYDRTTLHTGFVNNLFNVIDPEDIEDVRVLKNGTALYGAQGGNGVIEIKTRRGKSLATRIKVRVYGGFEQSPELTKVMNANQYRNYVSDFLGTTENAEYLNTPYAVSFLNEDKNYLFYDMYHNDTDWQKDLYRDAFTQNYKVSVEGGDDVAVYNLSLGYSQADATAKKNDFNRLNIRFNTDVVMFKNFTAAMDLSYSRNAYNLRDNGWASDYSSSNIASPNVLGLIQAPFLNKGSYYVYYEPDPTSNGLHLGYDPNVYAGKNFEEANNPLAFAQDFGFEGLANPYWILRNGEGDNKNYQEQTQFNINIAPKYQITPDLYITDRFSYILNRSNEKYYLPYNGTPSKEVEGLGDVKSVIRTQFGKETTLFNDFRIDWRHTYGSHYINAFGGFRLASYTYSDSRIAGYNNDNDKMPNMAYSLQYKDYGGSNDRWINLSYYLNAEYNFRNTYFLQAMASMQSSSRFGQETDAGIGLFGVRWGIFPSVQAAWVLSSEKWFKVKPINYMKITVGYDESGNDNIDYYASRTYFENVKFLDQATALQLANIQNAAIQWETNHRFNVGLETSLFNNRLFLGLNYYTSKTTDLLTRKAVSDIIGLPYIWSNDGELKNQGVDFNLNAVLVNTKDWKWQLGFSIGHYKNEITDLPGSSLNTITNYALDENGREDKTSATSIHGYTSSIYGENNILTAVGHAAGVFYGYKTAGVFSTDEEAKLAGKYGYLRYPTGLAQQPSRDFKAGDVHFVDQNGDGWISEADMVVIGDPNPDLYGNIYTSLTWKDLTLDLNFKYSIGNDVYNYQRSQLEAANNIWNQTTAVANRWRYEGQRTDVPRAMASTSDQWVNNERFSDRWIEDGSYLKLKKVRLTYRIPVKANWLQGLAVWGEANNVFTITEYLGSDPEVSCGNSVLYQGIDTGYLMQNRNFNLGVTINL